MDFHSMHWVVQNSETVFCMFRCSRKSANSFNSVLAPTKFLPWSLHIIIGLPRLEMNLRRHAIKASEVKSETTSEWTAFTDIETNTSTITVSFYYQRLGELFEDLSVVSHQIQSHSLDPLIELVTVETVCESTNAFTLSTLNIMHN